MRHLRQNEIQGYGTDALSRAGFLRVQTHLDECAECRRRLDEMYPNIAVAEEALLYEDPTEETADVFHLNYEEHLKPFVYETICPFDRELVEAHVESCSECRSDLRDLLEFHDELAREKEIAALSQRGLWAQIVGWFAAANRRMIWIAVTLLLFVLSSPFWISALRQPKENTELAPPTDNATDQHTVALAPSAEPPSVADSSTRQAANRNPAESSADTEYASLALPRFLDELRRDGVDTLRGDDVRSKPVEGLAPDRVVLLGTSHILRWKSVPEAESYEVAVFDADFNRVAGVSELRGTDWRTPVLAKGRIYRWQVTAISPGKQVTRVGQGKFYLASARDESAIEAARTPVQKGVALAEAGLLNEAADQFRLHLRLNPNSENTRKLLRQVERYLNK